MRTFINYAITCSFFSCIFNLSPLAAQTTADAVLGTWFNENKQSKIEIFRCNDKYCGRVIWLQEPATEEGPRVDKYNPEESLRSRPVLGLILMRDFVYGGDNVWTDGEIYDPRNGKTYSCKMALINKNRLDVRGFVGISLIGRTDTWTRAE